MKLIVILTATLAAVLAILLAGGSAVDAGSDERWSPPVPISGYDPRAGGWFPALAADVYGQVHVVWNGRLPGRPPPTNAEGRRRLTDMAGWLLYARWDGRRWSAPTEIAAIGDEGDALRSALAADPSGQLHLLYRGLDLRDPQVSGAENEPIRHAIADAASFDRGLTWSGGRAVSRRLPAYFSDVVVDTRGVLHVLTTESDADGRYAVYYHWSADGGRNWSIPRALDTEHAVSRWRLQLKHGPRNDLHAVWEVVDADEPSSRTPVGFVYARSGDNGATWTTTAFAPGKVDFAFPTRFEGTGWRIQPSVIVDGRGQTVLVWREDGTDLLYSQYSTDGTAWSPPQPIGGVAHGVARPFDRYDMATDSAGRVHLVMVGYPGDSTLMALLHSEWLGRGWSQPDAIVYAGSAPFPEWPRIAVSEGNRLHVVWFGGSLPTVDRVATGIWYSTRLTSAPHIPATPLPIARSASPATPRVVVSPTTELRVKPVQQPETEMATSGSLRGVDDLQPRAWPIAAGVAGACGLLAVTLLVRRLRTSR
ncbi:MAG: exo-alpha-sialidase [Chloroflexi bacterium]|nr:exo-alpha-sialidase [Chloroflexota bacterium]